MNELRSFDSFLNNPSEKFAKIDGTICNSFVQCKLEINGNVYPQPTCPESNERIRFAIVGPHFEFGTTEMIGTKESSEILTSANQNIRSRYVFLKKEFQEEIKNSLSQLFGIDDIVYESEASFGGGVNTLEFKEGSRSWNPMFLGGAVQKVFATLTLLFTLASAKERKRIFLIEEPEATLYPSIIKTFFTILVELCTSHGIQLITTSNSHEVIDSIDYNHILAMIDPPQFVNDKDMLFAVGKDDGYFISKMATLLGISITHVHMVNKQTCSLQQKRQLSDAVKKVTGHSVYFLKDPDFTAPDKVHIREAEDQKATGAKVVFWDLPSVESYLILHEVIATKRSTADFLANIDALAVHYFGGIKAQKINNNTPTVLHVWTTAVEEEKKENPDWTKIVRVIHGHTWFELVLKKSTSTYICQYVDKTIFTACPTLKAKIKAIVGCE